MGKTIIKKADEICWIRDELQRLYPQADLSKGVDLDNNHTLEPNERISDSNHNGYIDETDWRAFLKKNQTTVSRQEGIFKWGAPFQPDNPIHDVLGTEMALFGPEKIKSAYELVQKILNILKGKLFSADTLDKKLKALNATLQEMGFNYVYDQSTDQLTTALASLHLDCDTFGFILLAIGHELHWPVTLAASPGHIFCRWHVDAKTHFSFSYNVSFSNDKIIPDIISENEQELQDDDDITKNDLKKGLFYFNDFKRQDLKALLLANRAFSWSMRGKNPEALADLNQALALNSAWPDIWNTRAELAYKMHLPQEMIRALKQTFRLHPENSYAKRMQRAWGEKPVTAEDYLEKGLFEAESHWYAEAIQDLTKAEELAPGSVPSNFFQELRSNLWR